jgi:hypothetical protein
MVLLTLVACTSSKPSPQESLVSIIIERAQISDNAKTFHLSKKLYSKLVELEPNKISHHYGYVRSINNISDVNALKDYIDISDDYQLWADDKYVSFLVMSLLYHNLNEQASIALTRGINFKLKEATIFRLRSAIDINKGQYQRAENSYLECLSLPSGFQPCLFDYWKFLKNTKQISKLNDLEKNYELSDMPKETDVLN